MKLRVWHIPQVPMSNPFLVEVPDIDTAKLVMKALWSYDSYQFDNDIKPDYSNASGLECYNAEADAWEEWSDDNGEYIEDIMDAEEDEKEGEEDAA